MKKENMAMLCDFYEFTMSNGYFKNGFYKKNVYFDVFFRKVPDNGGFAIMAGLEQAIEYIRELHFEDEDIEYLKSKGIFDEQFLEYLRNFKFSGDVYAIPEGTPIFPNEPVMTIKAPAIEAQLVETFLLLTINHQTLIATKANRIVRAAQGRAVLEFGSRRAQGANAAVDGARAAYIGGCKGTACTLTDELYGVPAGGTMAHSWVQMFNSEYDAFKTYCEMYPDNPTLLVDTYNTLKSGVPNAIKVFKEVLLPQGKTKCAIRLDSGDISYLSKKARKMLDDAGLTECTITASNALDEYLIRDLMMQGAQVDTFGVGERLITSSSSPVFGGVYKLVAVENDGGEIVPKIKVSENTTKITNPHFKRFTVILTRTAVRLLPMSFAFMMRLLTIQSREQFSIRMQFGKQKCLITTPQRNFLCQSSRTASACMSHRQLRKSQPIAVSRLTFSGTRLSVLKIRITIMLTSQRNSMTSRLFCSISMKSDF